MGEVRPILTQEDPRLRQKTVLVQRITARTRRLVDDLRATMYAADGVGIAAPQIGAPERVIIVGFSENPKGEARLKPNPMVLINPIIMKRSKDTTTEEEGCLSCPGALVPIKRSWQIKVHASGLDGKRFALIADGFLARVIQHEVDHLFGRLIIDYT